MIFISYIGEEGEQKEVFVFSDKSLGEVKKFTAKDPGYIKKNTGTLGTYYTKKSLHIDCPIVLKNLKPVAIILMIPTLPTN